MKKKYEVKYLPAPERIHSSPSAVTLQRDLPRVQRRAVKPRRRLPVR